MTSDRDRVTGRDSGFGLGDDKSHGLEPSSRVLNVPGNGSLEFWLTGVAESANFASHRGTAADPNAKKKKATGGAGAGVPNGISSNESKNFIKSLHYAMLSSPVLGKPLGNK
jgi:hypothetical protein